LKKERYMDVSRQEEIISILWIIAALIAFGNGFDGWGWAFAIKGGLDTATAIWFAIKEIIAGIKAKGTTSNLRSVQGMKVSKK
jgi:hypothetical protein